MTRRFRLRGTPTVPLINLAMKPQAALGRLQSSSIESSLSKSPLMQTVDSMTTAVRDLTTQMTAQQVALSGKGLFGKDTLGKVVASPLIDFLGGLFGGDDKSRPERIPGGKSLYTKGQGMFHKGAPGAPDTYAFENSPAGIEFAAKNGYASIDIDMLITKDGVPVATHWAQPMKKDDFYDPLGKLDKDTKVKDMTLAEVMRLRNKDGQSQIYPVSTMIEHLKKHGIAGDFEAKDDPRFASDEIMGGLADQVRSSGIKANLKSIHRGEGTEKILKKAQANGFYVRIALPKDGQKKYWGYGD